MTIYDHTTPAVPWAQAPAAPAVPWQVTVARWVWLVVPSASAVVTAVTADVTGFPMLTDVLAVGTAILALVSLPAAITLLKGNRWAPKLLLFISAASAASSYKCIRLGMWPALAFNLPLLGTSWLLRAPASAAYFAAAQERRAPLS